MIGYKIVAIKNSRAYAPATSNALQRITYRIGKITEPDDSGPVALFATLDAARIWYEHGTHHGDCIIAVEYDSPSDSKILWKRRPPSYERNTWGRGYHAVSEGTQERHIDDCPVGTVLADRVTPLSYLPL